MSLPQLRSRKGMYRSAGNPARQLNSKAIKDAASCYFSPIIRNRLSVVTATCVWRVQRKDLTEAWKLVCKKREECDRALMSLEGLEFFFSAIGVKEPPKKEEAKERSEECYENENDEENEDSVVPDSPQISQATEKSFAMAAEKKRFPSFSFWMAFTSSTGAPVSVLPVQKVFLSCDLEINVQIHRTVEKSIKSLFPVLKDHSSSYVIELVEASFHATITDLADQLSCQGLLSSPMNCSTEKVVFFHMNSPSKKKKEIINALEAMKKAGLRVAIFDAETNAMVKINTPDKCITSDPKVLLIGNIERAMESLGYKLYRGSIYKKVKEAKCTYRYKCSVADWLGALEGNENFQEGLIKHGDQVRERLSRPESQTIRQLIVNFDLIEVNDGWFFSIIQQTFLQDAIEEREVGKVSPRAFVAYDHCNGPEPRYFKEILENSLKKHEVQLFCEDFMNLLRYNQKTHKQKVQYTCAFTGLQI